MQVKRLNYPFQITQLQLQLQIVQYLTLEVLRYMYTVHVASIANSAILLRTPSNHAVAPDEPVRIQNEQRPTMQILRPHSTHTHLPFSPSFERSLHRIANAHLALHIRRKCQRICGLDKFSGNNDTPNWDTYDALTPQESNSWHVS